MLLSQHCYKPWFQELLEKLMESGSDIKATDHNGNTVLFCAARSMYNLLYKLGDRQAATIEAGIALLVQKGANTSAVNQNGDTV